MVDAAIGGKTGINLSKGKNLVGSFHSPRKVIVDTNLLNSLTQRDINAGLAESIKAGFIGDERILELIEKDSARNLPEIIERSIRVKAKVVSKDFKESDEREILNYGHTLGHAIEKHSKYKLRHGEAISIGLGFAAKLSNKISGLSDELARRHFVILNSLNLPTTYERSAWPKLYEFMGRDKKRKDGLIRFVTLKDIGKSDRISAPESTLSALYREISR
jgi:3-dehydroquinate synthase